MLDFQKRIEYTDLNMIRDKGKDGRELSEFQSSEWMKAIGKNRKYKNQAKGEANGNAKLIEFEVVGIRASQVGMRRVVCKLLGICERHWYMIRARQKWKHLK